MRAKNYEGAKQAIDAMIAKQPQSVMTYEYLLAACAAADPRVLNYIYAAAVQRLPDHALLRAQYGEFLEELNQFAAAHEMFRAAYAITPTDDLLRSMLRVGARRGVDADGGGAGRAVRGERAAGRAAG